MGGLGLMIQQRRQGRWQQGTWVWAKRVWLWGHSWLLATDLVASFGYGSLVRDAAAAWNGGARAYFHGIQTNSIWDIAKCGPVWYRRGFAGDDVFVEGHDGGALLELPLYWWACHQMETFDCVLNGTVHDMDVSQVWCRRAHGAGDDRTWWSDGERVLSVGIQGKSSIWNTTPPNVKRIPLFPFSLVPFELIRSDGQVD